MLILYFDKIDSFHFIVFTIGMSFGKVTSRKSQEICS